MSFLRRLQRPSATAALQQDAHDPQFAGLYPALHEHLVRTTDEEGKRRQTCSLAIYGVAGRFKGFLNDRDSGGSLGADSDTFTGLLAAFEAELESDRPAWFWREGNGQSNQKKRGKGA